MALFVDVHDLNGCDADTFMSGWLEQTGDGIRCLQHWVSADTIALLVEAPDEEQLRAGDPHAIEVTELFAPAARWAAARTSEIFERRGGRHE